MGEKSVQKRKYILKKAREVFAEKGFKDVTMKDVVDACDISRGGLYLYFASTQELFLAVLREEIDEDEDCDYPYLGDLVRQAALDGAMAYTQAYLREKCGMASVAFQNPGSAEDWADKLVNRDIALLTRAEEIGIRVDERGNMTPWYSTVGIFTEA